MKTAFTFGATILALAAAALSCFTVACQSTGGPKVYLVGVAGGG